ncbi:polysaccharide biosynthesis C-terminal domain-containing protein [Arundinibacter roseus]|uniref:Polysaccharide biosynthesis protein n=1 Tax=Arundinibacter roseus TaxID=2070510 RepID=A0A4R4KR76_9BACT|nr:polysaccharide biosynthesis C-terminal domain-containing protein [Arundinibacter roseus]TDB68911.1 polysaccharide biosynthesis protein [Arundinibacter roseus]
MSVLKKLAGETATYGVSTMLGRLLNYLLVILHTQLFVPAELAVQVQLYTYAGLSFVLYTFGMETAFFRFAQKETDRTHYYNLIMSAVVLVSVVFSGSILLFAEPIARFIQYPEEVRLVRWMAIIMATDSIVAIPFARLRLEKKAKKFVRIRVVNILLNIGLNIFFLVICQDIIDGKYLTVFQPVVSLFYNPAIAPAYIIMANLVANLTFFWFLRQEIRDFTFLWNLSIFKPVWVYAFPIMVMNIAGATNLLFDRMFLQYLLPENFYAGRTTKDAIGIYGQAFKLSIFMNLSIQAFKYAAEPFFFSKAEDKNAPAVFAQIMKWFIIVCVLMWVGICLNLDLLATLFLRKKIYHEGLIVVPWLLLGFLFLGVYYNLAAWFKLTDKTHYGTYLTLTGASTTALLNILLVPHLGYFGCALAFAGSGSLMAGLCYYFGQKFYPVPYNLSSALGYIGVGGLFIYAASWIVLPDFWQTFVVKALLFLVFIITTLLIERQTLPPQLRRYLGASA